MTSRYLIIGCSGSGKSTTAKMLSETLNIPYYNTDTLYWSNNWQLSSDQEVIKKLPFNDSSWIFDGNFISDRALVWDAADCIIWLNKPAIITIFRVIKRNLSWCLRPGDWSSDKMPLSIAISGIKHAAKQAFRHKRRMPEYLNEFRHKKIQIFRSDHDCELWLQQLAVQNNKPGY